MAFRTILVIAVTAALCSLGAALPARPTKGIMQWSQYEFGAMISWNIDTMDSIQGCQPGLKALPDPALFDGAVDVDFESWARIMQSTGIKYSTLTVKHGCGFTLWPSKVHDIEGLTKYNYTIGLNPKFAGRDLVAEYIAACKKFDIKPGFYYSLGSNYYLGVYNNHFSNSSTVPLPGQNFITEDAYHQVVLQHMEELLENYPGLAEMWYDGGVPDAIREQLVTLYEKHAPDTVVFQGIGVTPNAVRWDETESGHPTQEMWSMTNAAGTPSENGTVWYPAECDTPMQNSDTWFWNPNAGVRPLEEMKNVYRDTVGNNCNMMVNLAPDKAGVVHYEENYRALGDFISLCYPSDVSKYPASIVEPPISAEHVASLLFKSPLDIDRVVLQEDQTRGQCVLGYTVTVEVGGKAVASMEKKWIGHKRILELPQVVSKATAIHVEITKQQDNCAPQLTLIAASNCQFAK